LLNESVDPKTSEYGIPYPGTLVLNRRGEVASRFFEESYQDRNTVASVLTKINGGGASPQPATQVSTTHLDLLASASDSVVAPGNRFSVLVDVSPKPGIHVYAPGAHDYKPIAMNVGQQPFIRVHETQYPPSEDFFFAPLNEHVPVFQKPFRLLTDITIDASQQAQAALKGQESLTIRGTVDYQACDDKICFIPASVPVTWTLKLKPLDRERAARP
jgi:DsbC/DsbD-like thiol-disulfide interchange protein